MILSKHIKTSTTYRDVFDVWEAIQGTVQAHMEDCHRLIKDMATQRGRLTLQSYLHTFQPEGWEVAPMGCFYLRPKGTCTKEANVNASPHSVTGEETQHFNYLGMEHTHQPPFTWHHEAQLPLIDCILFFFALSCAFIRKAVRGKKQCTL